jgi:hypothetical protein
VGFLQLLGTIVATDFDRSAADFHLDAICIELRIASGASGFVHDVFLLGPM